MSKIQVSKLPMLGKKRWQPLFRFLYRLSLHGMNFGPGADPRTSGELFVLQYIKEKLNGAENPVLFDAGANIGDYTIFLSDFFGAKALIHSFEPSAAAFAKMKEKVGNRGGIQLNNMGLGEQIGELTLYANDAGSALGSLYKRRLDHFNTRMDKTESVKVSTVDDYALSRGIDKIDFLKIDVEGHELKVLHGAKKMIDNQAIKFIQFEFGGTMIDSRVFFQDFYYFLKDKYKIYRVLRDGLEEIANYREDCECFNCCNYLAERKD